MRQAKELGWCVHEVEEVELDKLENLEWKEIDFMFKEPGHVCSICIPGPASD